MTTRVGVAAEAFLGARARRPGCWSDALLVAAAHFVLLSVTQIENAVFHAAGTIPNGAELLLRLPLFGGEIVLACLLLALVGRGLAGSLPGRVALFVLVSALNLELITDQLGYKVFFDHLRCSYAEEGFSGLAALRDSVRAIIDARAWLNVGLFAFSSGALGWWLFGGRWSGLRARLDRRLNRIALRPGAWAAGGGFLVVAMWYGAAPSDLHLAEYPPAVLAADCLGFTQASAPRIDAPTSGFRKLRFDSVAPPAVIPNAPWRARAARPLNVVLVVLESIGARQLLPGGSPSPEVAPFMSRMARQGVLYDTLYATYPASIVSNISLTTGGPSLSWGKMHELDKPYTGPTLVGTLKSHGYRTALFSSADLDFGNLGAFFGGLEYGYVFDFAHSPAGFRTANAANSWGADDANVLRLAAAWATRNGSRERPFYLRIQTNLAHHPYTTPPGYHTDIREPRAEKKRYLDAIHYLDSLLADFYAELSAADLAKDTLFVFSGDHGEAFGEWHSRNFLHRNYLYEENVRSFMLLANPGRLERGQRISTPAFNGDLMPTVLGLIGVPVPSGIDGQDLSSGRYHPQILYFHKNNHPETWGLRDGRWKFIGTFSGDRLELYDLTLDPTEQRNVAHEHPRQVATYQSLSANWYVVQNRTFMSRLDGWRPVGKYDYRPDDFAIRGPKALTVGYRDSVHDIFTEARRLNPREPLLTWTKWVSYRQPTRVEFRWKGPHGQTYSRFQRVSPDDVVTQTRLPSSKSLREGTWCVELLRKGRVLLAAKFEIDARVPLHDVARVPIPPRDIRVVALGANVEVRKLRAGEPLPAGNRLALDVRWPRAAIDRLVTLRWRSPSGRFSHYRIRVPGGHSESLIHHGGPYPMERGPWLLTLWSAGTRISSKIVRVGTSTTTTFTGRAVGPRLARR